MNTLVDNPTLYTQSRLLHSLCERNRKQHTQSARLSNEEQLVIQQTITELSENILDFYSLEQDTIRKAEALIAVMDAREICGTEKQLQQALSLAEQLLCHIPDSPLKCKLLSYCYYYVEEPECAEEALRIIESWDKTQYTREMREALEYYRKLVPQPAIRM